MWEQFLQFGKMNRGARKFFFQHMLIVIKQKIVENL